MKTAKYMMYLIVLLGVYMDDKSELPKSEANGIAFDANFS